jgi:Tfp pilus assembly protein PilO
MIFAIIQSTLIAVLAGWLIYSRRKIKTMSDQTLKLEEQLSLSEKETAETIAVLDAKKAELAAVKSENESLMIELANCKGESVEKDAIIERAIASLSASNALLDAAQQ